MKIENGEKLLFLEGKFNFPIEWVTNKPVTSFIRRILFTRRIMRYSTWKALGGCDINF